MPAIGAVNPIEAIRAMKPRRDMRPSLTALIIDRSLSSSMDPSLLADEPSPSLGQIVCQVSPGTVHLILSSIRSTCNRLRAISSAAASRPWVVVVDLLSLGSAASRSYIRPAIHSCPNKGHGRQTPKVSLSEQRPLCAEAKSSSTMSQHERARTMAAPSLASQALATSIRSYQGLNSLCLEAFCSS